MNRFLHGLARAGAEAFALPGPVLEIGSYQVPGQQDLINLRALFPGKAYQGVDVRSGPGVDLVADVERLPHADASVGTVIAMSTFEHVRRFWRGFAEIERVLRPDGALLVSCPFALHVHNYPGDYWRFTPQALELLLENYPHKIIGWQGPDRRPGNVWALAFRAARPPFTAADLDRYRLLLHRYAREPLSWGRALRYQLGRWLCGLRPFDYYLRQNHWKILCRTPPSPPPPGRRGKQVGTRNGPLPAAATYALPAK
jgi:SAM-dependent methyltransferase